jgi:hypothetical protein
MKQNAGLGYFDFSGGKVNDGKSELNCKLNV